MAYPICEWSISSYEENAEKYDKYINELENWQSIPIINFKTITSMSDGCLARYQGMVQDVMNPEYYFAKYQVKDNLTGSVTSRSGRLRDVLHCQESEELLDEKHLDVRDQAIRQPLFCIPIPGLNEWALPVTCDEIQSVASVSIESSGTKRPLEEDDGMQVDEDRKQRAAPTLENSKSKEIPVSFDCKKYFPCPEEKGMACIVKHYGEQDDFLVNTRVEVIGFVSLSPALEATWDDNDAEDRATHPPPSLVPRIHAIKIRKLNHCNPLLHYAPSQDGLEESAIYSDLHTVLTQLLFGDTLAAEYLILNLLSTVYCRKDGLALGALSVNLYNVPNLPGYAKILYEFLQTLLPSSVYLPLSIDLLNTSNFVPRKDYETNKLWSGRLQLPDDTHLLVDETVMNAGRLGEAGVKNIAALHDLTLGQELRYDFSYFQHNFHTNIPVLILSEGKSMIPTDVPLKLACEDMSSMSETFSAARFFMSGARLEASRQYLSLLRLRECDISGTEFVGPAWADLRQQHQDLKLEDLHRLLVLSRLTALANGRRILTRVDWDKALSMEQTRRSRANSRS